MVTWSSAAATGTTEPGPEEGDPEPVLPSPLLELTDEETVVLFGDSLVATPFLDQVPDEARALVLHTAYRSLVAHEVIHELDVEPAATLGATPIGTDPDPEQDGDGARREAQVSEALAAVVDIRVGAPVLLCLQRLVADELVLRYAHVVGDFVLVEDVLATGLHRFGSLDRPDLGRCLQAFLVPDDAVTGPDPEPPWSAEMLAASTVLVDATVRHALDDGPGDLVGLFLGPAGSWCTRQPFGATSRARLEPVDPRAVGDLVAKLVEQAEHAVDAALGPEVSSRRDPAASSP